MILAGKLVDFYVASCSFPLVSEGMHKQFYLQKPSRGVSQPPTIYMKFLLRLNIFP